MHVRTNAGDIIQCYFFGSDEPEYIELDSPEIITKYADIYKQKRILSGFQDPEDSDDQEDQEDSDHEMIAIRILATNLGESRPMTFEDLCSLRDTPNESFNKIRNNCLNLPGINRPIGLSLINTPNGIPILGTIHKWFEASLMDIIVDDETKKCNLITGSGPIESHLRVLPRDARISRLEDFLEISKNLDKIHSLGLVHRDLKPENIFLSPEGPVISDIDSFETIGTIGTGFGTDFFRSPEEYYEECITAKTDSHGLIMTMFDTLINDLPDTLEDLLDGEDNSCPRYQAEVLLTFMENLSKEQVDQDTKMILDTLIELLKTCPESCTGHIKDLLMKMTLP